MKKLLLPALCLTMALTASASALEYNIDAPAGATMGKPTSIEVVQTADGGATPNEDISKNAALIPPGFGTAASYLPGSGDYLTPNLAPEGKVGAGTVNGSAASVMPPALSTGTVSGESTTVVPGSSTVTVSSGYTDVTSDLYYSNGSLGTLSIPKLGLTVRIYEGTDSATLAKGVGHFANTSIWGGNVAVAAHNRGVNAYFGEIHTLGAGDIITLTTKLGTRTYTVTSVNKISETDTSMLNPTAESCITLFTCVRDQRAYRWCVRAVEV